MSQSMRELVFGVFFVLQISASELRPCVGSGRACNLPTHMNAAPTGSEITLYPNPRVHRSRHEEGYLRVIGRSERPQHRLGPSMRLARRCRRCCYHRWPAIWRRTLPAFTRRGRRRKRSMSSRRKASYRSSGCSPPAGIRRCARYR